LFLPREELFFGDLDELLVGFIVSSSLSGIENGDLELSDLLLHDDGLDF